MASSLFTVKRESKKDDGLARGTSPAELEAEQDLPPVVARMVVEIRSDGTRTIARGALEDLLTGERVALQANAKNPVELARELTKTLLKTPVLAGSLAKDALLDLLPPSIKKGPLGKLASAALKKKKVP